MEHRCLDCDTTFSEDETKCPSCGKEEFEEIYHCKCTECDWSGDINSNDPCPDCEAELEEDE